MSALPLSSAAANATEHACSRHAHILGPRFCAECRAPLCTACARTATHRSCPSCNVAAGRQASVVDVGWYATLFIDGLAHSLSTVKRRLLPFAIGVFMVGVAGGLSGAASRDKLLFGHLGDETATLAVVAFTLATWLGLGAQPGLAVPTLARGGLWRRTLRSLFSGALIGCAPLATMALGAGLLVVGSQTDGNLFFVAGVLVCAAAAAAAFLFSSTFLPIQAAYAVGRRSLFGALTLPFKAGPAALAILTVTWLMMMGSLYMSSYLLFVPTVFLMVLSKWVGVTLGVAIGTAGYVLLLIVTGAYGSAGMRFCEERAKA